MGMERNGTRLNGDQAAESPPRFDWRHGKTLSFSLSSPFVAHIHSQTPQGTHLREARGDRREATCALD